MKNNKAFTLIELLVAIAIIGILAAVVLVSMSSYAKKARASRALAQASSVIPSMVSCWGNIGKVKTSDPLSGGGDICDMSPSYGQWPVLPTGYKFSAVKGTSSGSFSFSVTGESQTICCDSKINSCKIVDSGESCSASSGPILH